MARIFLSYAREDAAAAKELAESLSHEGHEVWWDFHIHGGSRFAAEIDRALKDAEAVVVLWSESSIQSAWVQDEAAEARDTNRLIPVTLGECKPPLGFRQFHSVDLGHWTGDSKPRTIDALLHAIAKMVGSDQKGAKPAYSAKPGRKVGASICVLPFVNMSGDAEQEYFSDGITEDIITDLSKVSALSVVARNTAFTVKGRALDVKEVARDMNVSHVVEGSVRKAGSRVRITAQLIDGEAGDHLWAERYDRELNDIFAIQDEISKAIVSALRVKLLPGEKKAIETRGTSSVEAYNVYLMAREHWMNSTFGDIRRDEAIVRLCRQATLLDPNYAQAWALMALAQSQLRYWHGTAENSLPAAERAIAINPDLAEAHCVKALHFEEEGRLEDANRQIMLAVRLDPESWEVNREAAKIMYRQGRIHEAIPFFQKAAAILDTDFHDGAMLMSCFRAVGDAEALVDAAKMTLERTERALARDPTNVQALADGAAALAMLGEEQMSAEWAKRALLLDPENLTMRYNLACSLILDERNTEFVLELMQSFCDGVKSANYLRFADVDPDFASLRDHPRFQQMMAAAKERLGVPHLAEQSAPQELRTN